MLYSRAPHLLKTLILAALATGQLCCQPPGDQLIGQAQAQAPPDATEVTEDAIDSPQPQELEPSEAFSSEEVRWQLEPVGARAPYFPYLPGEDQTISRSIGDVSYGYLIEAARLRWPHPSLATLKVQSERHLIYATYELIKILELAALHVQKTSPEAITYLGNLGQLGGGDIRWSVSHNSGRDADVAFFVTDEQGRPAIMPDLLPLDEQGRYEGEHGVFLFDVPRSWALVEGLLIAGGDKLQYIFVADWLREMLLEHARAQGAEPVHIARAAQLLQQPRATLPHHDHFHVRIYCSPQDVASGCDDVGRYQPWFNRHSEHKRDAVEASLKAIKDDDPEVRVAGIRRLVLLDGRSHWSLIAGALKDDAPVVRAAAARALGQLGRGDRELARALASPEPHDRVAVELVDALSQLGTRVAIDALVDLLEQPKRVLALDDTLREDIRLLAAEALATTESTRAVKPLIALLEEQDPALRSSAARALRLLTNHSFMEDWSSADEPTLVAGRQAWAQWWEAHRRMKRERWLMLGFEQAGLKLDRLNKSAVWTLCRALDERAHTTYNAQRVLMRLFKHDPRSLNWSWQDANFYWRRWLERRSRRLGLPKMPPELSTQAGYSQIVKDSLKGKPAAKKKGSKKR